MILLSQLISATNSLRSSSFLRLQHSEPYSKTAYPSLAYPLISSSLAYPLLVSYFLAYPSLVSSSLRNRNLQTSKAPLKSQAQGTNLFTSAASNQRGFPIVRGRLRSGYQRVRMRQIRGVFQRIVRGKLRSGCQRVRENRLGVKAGVV